MMFRPLMIFRPLQDRVVVRRVDPEQKTAGGIFIPPGAASVAPLLITTEVTVAQGTDKSSSPMLNAGMGETGF